jgi:hypothetical protein
LLLLAGGTAAFWLLVGLPARHLGGGDEAMVFSGTAALLCLVPTAATLVWAERAGRNSPLIVLGGTGVRMGAALAGGLALGIGVPYFQDRPAFWIWLVVMYLFTLAFDVLLLAGGRPGSG